MPARPWHSSVAGVDAPAFVERTLTFTAQTVRAPVSPGLTLRPSLSAQVGCRASCTRTVSPVALRAPSASGPTTTSISTPVRMRFIHQTLPAPTLISPGRLSHRSLAQGALRRRVFVGTGTHARRLQDIESDTGYDTRRRVLDGVFARVSQTTVYDTCGSATAVALVGWVFRS